MKRLIVLLAATAVAASLMANASAQGTGAKMDNGKKAHKMTHQVKGHKGGKMAMHKRHHNRKMVHKGRAMVKEGKEDIKQGQKDIKKGRKMIRKGGGKMVGKKKMAGKM